jgi:hypothetical protein
VSFMAIAMKLTHDPGGALTSVMVRS